MRDDFTPVNQLMQILVVHLKLCRFYSLAVLFSSTCQPVMRAVVVLSLHTLI